MCFTDVTHGIEKTLTTAKESVSTAITGITNDLGNAVKEKTHELDEAKNNLMEKLHLSSNAAQADSDEHDEGDDTNAAVEIMDERLSRAPTPALETDSIKSNATEPEIAAAFAKFQNESPPTIQAAKVELEHLNVKVSAIESVQAVTEAAEDKAVAMPKSETAVE